MRNTGKQRELPLVFDRMEINESSYQQIRSPEKLREVISYMLRMDQFKTYATQGIINNVYMDVLGKVYFKRAISMPERPMIKRNIIRYARGLQPDFEDKTYLEMARCYFQFSDDAMSTHWKKKDGSAIAVTLSGKEIMEFFTRCLEARKTYAGQAREAALKDISEKNAGFIRLSNVRDVLFEMLALDDIQSDEKGYFVNLYTIYLLQ